jgi:DNA-binding IclR family transcriptional regulator
MTSESSKPIADNSGAPGSSLFIASVEKTFRVLRAFDGPQRYMTMTDIARQAQLGRSGAQRIVYTLETLGYLQRIPGTKTYGVTSLLLSLSYNYVRSHELIDKALPYLQELNREFGETSNLQELSGTQIILVARFLSKHLLNVSVAVGSRLPAFCTASGNAILSSFSVEERDAILAASDLTPLTPYTVTDVGRVRERIEKAAIKGYTIVANESMLGDISVAAPVLDQTGRGIAAVNVSVPAARWTIEDVEAKLASHVQNAAAVLSMRNASRNMG